MAEPNWLNPREDRAWRGYLRMRALLHLQIGRELAADSQLSEADFHVLVRLSEAPEQRLRLTELAAGIAWSTSRLGHHVNRMQARELVCRESLPTNSRAAVVTLTDTGRRIIEAAAPLHLLSVRRHFIDLLTAEQLDALAGIADAVTGHLQTECREP